MTRSRDHDREIVIHIEINDRSARDMRRTIPKRWSVCRSAAAAILVSGLLPVSASARPVYETILLDAQTGQILLDLNADIPTPPASLTKMMTLYLSFEALNQGRLRLDQSLPVSDYAASRAPSKLGLKPGEAISVQDLILGIVTKSANDAAVVLAEALGGSEADFAQQMNSKARQLGMNATLYDNASGLPDPNQHTTARDIARLALALYQQFPDECRYFSTRAFVFRGRQVRNYNHLLDWYPGLDGIKTGFVNGSGFDLAASAVRGGRRLIGVVMGGRSADWRDRQMAALLDHGFAISESDERHRAQLWQVCSLRPHRVRRRQGAGLWHHFECVAGIGRRSARDGWKLPRQRSTALIKLFRAGSSAAQVLNARFAAALTRACPSRVAAGCGRSAPHPAEQRARLLSSSDAAFRQSPAKCSHMCRGAGDA